MHLSIKQFMACIALAGVIPLTTLHSPVFAHHGGGLEWQSGVTSGPVTGVATRFAFTFPHVLIYLDVTDENGSVQNYAMNIRWTPTILRKHGWNRDSIKPGDTLKVAYMPHRTNPYVGFVIHLEVNGKLLETNFSD